MPSRQSITKRTCLDCGVDISLRGARAKRCEPCAIEVKAQRHRDRVREKNADRTCGRCGVSIAHRHGVSRYCESCVVEGRRERQREKYQSDDEWRARRNAESKAGYQARMEDPESREKELQYRREWKRRKYHEEPEWKAKENARRVETQRRRREVEPGYRRREAAEETVRRRERMKDPEYREQQNAKSRAYRYERYRNDPEYREYTLAYSKVRKPWDETVTPESVAGVLDAQGGRCACCRKDIRGAYSLDHILPLTKGGASMLANLQVLCRSCNSSKGNRLAYFPPDGGQGALALGFAD